MEVSPKASLAVWMLPVAFQSVWDPRAAASEAVTVPPALLLHHTPAEALRKHEHSVVWC